MGRARARRLLPLDNNHNRRPKASYRRGKNERFFPRPQQVIRKKEMTTQLEPNRHEVMQADDGQRIEMQRWMRGILREVYYCSVEQLADNLEAWQHWQVIIHRSAWWLAPGLRAAGLRAETLAGVAAEV